MSEHPVVSEKAERKVNMIYLVLSILGFCVLALQQYGNEVAIKTRQEQGQVKMEENQTEMNKALETNRKETKGQLETITSQLSDFKATQQEQKYILTGLTTDLGKLSGSIDANKADDSRQWDVIQATQVKANGAVQKTDFLEWRIELERKNPTVTSPALKTQSP